MKIIECKTGALIYPLRKIEDDRGWLCEIFRQDQLYPEHWPVMAYVSQTLPGVRRGPHEHREQTDYFAFIGPGDFELYLWQTALHCGNGRAEPTAVHEVGESNPCAVLVPPGIVHAYKCISETPGLVFNAPNQLYAGPSKAYEVDEIRHEEETV